MYFKEKENTNIDEEFQQKKTIDIKKFKPLIIIIGAVLVLFIIVFVAFSLTRKDPVVTYSINLQGDSTITLTLGNDYIEAGYSAFDSNNNDLTNEVEVSSNLRINEVGIYEITYKLKDTQTIRTINIVEPTNDTYIYLKGEKNIYLKVGAKYKEPGYVAHDTIDGELTDKVIVTGKVNTKKKGLYKIVYSVTNTKEITTQVERNIIVE